MTSEKQTKVLVLGASGMLGNAVLRFFNGSEGFQVTGSIRSGRASGLLPLELQEKIICGIDVENTDSLTGLFARVRPHVVINCIGLVKQLAEADDPLTAIPINSLLPHRLARLCDLAGARFIHISTDCVFSGDRGMYSENDASDARDLYGMSKYLGEVDYPHAVTLRTSIIGHELDSAHGLIAWFLAQNGEVKGFTQAVFSGLPTVELARVIRDFVIPCTGLRGLYHVSTKPIAKYDLLTLVAEAYGKIITITPEEKLVLDRSLNSERFSASTGYVAPEWRDLVRDMYKFK